MGAFAYSHVTRAVRNGQLSKTFNTCLDAPIMHRFWEIDEMVRLLATILKNQYTASASAVALACCSKRLEVIVLDPVWEELRGLDFLMRCLPPDTWKMQDREFVSTACSGPLVFWGLALTGQQTFLRCPSNKEWTRFSRYARRIRTFHLQNDALDGPGVSLAAFNILSMHPPTPDQYLLPNLRTIHWDIDLWELAPFLRLFLNPGLTTVYIEFADVYPHLYRSATVSLIPTRNLAHLQLKYVEDDDLYLGALHDLLDEASETLRSVSLDGQLTVAIIEKLLQLPNLYHLDVQLPWERISPPAVVFPSLKKLDVGYEEAWSLPHILKNIPNPTLQELDAFFTGSSLEYLQMLGSSLADANVERTLTSLKCTSENIIPLTEAGIRPLLSFGRLTTLELVVNCSGGQCGVKLDDSIITDLAKTLPQLTFLGLGGIPCDASTSEVTVASLVALSTNCVDLVFLQLHFNTRDITACGTHANFRARKFTCKLCTLSVGSQPLPSNHDDILLLASTILHIFPHVGIHPYTRGGWRQVIEGIQMFRNAPRITPLPV